MNESCIWESSLSHLFKLIYFLHFYFHSLWLSLSWNINEDIIVVIKELETLVSLNKLTVIFYLTREIGRPVLDIHCYLSWDHKFLWHQTVSRHYKKL